MATWTTIITAALTELGAIAVGQTPNAATVNLALAKAQLLIDLWNADRQAVYADVFSSFTLTPNLQPHTIGPTGTFTMAQRPVTIDGASIGLNNASPIVYYDLEMHDAAWWQDQTIPDIATDNPTDGYYDPTWPNGSLYLWPVPTVAYLFQMRTRQLLSTTFTPATTFDLPPGYQQAITLTLAEDLGPMFFREAAPTTVKKAQAARAIIFANNDEPVRLVTRDAGMPGSTRSQWNYRTGLIGSSH